MKYDQYGQAHTDVAELYKLLYTNPTIDISHFVVDDPDLFNNSVKALHCEMPVLEQYTVIEGSVQDFDHNNHQKWFMPDEYKTLDIAKWILEQCKTDAELQRTGIELLMFQERNLFPMLCYLKYLVDTMRKNNILWGVGRGSSVASFVLYLIGIHRINSLFYNLPIEEFLK
jgi:DNA polymerase III alpha subunit